MAQPWFLKHELQGGDALFALSAHWLWHDLDRFEVEQKKVKAGELESCHVGAIPEMSWHRICILTDVNEPLRGKSLEIIQSLVPNEKWRSIAANAQMQIGIWIFEVFDFC